MTNQSGRIAVTLTNTGTSTWSQGYGLGTLVFPASDTTGTGTPLTNGSDVVFSTTVAPGQAVTVESVTPPENPGTYTICWDMQNPAGAYFSAEGGSEYCAPYTIQQYPAQITEQEPLPGADVDTQTPLLSASATVPGGYPAKPVFSYAFQIVTPGTNPITGSPQWTVAQSSGWVANSGNSWSPTNPLAWGGTYYWQVTVSDQTPPPAMSTTSLTWTTPISFVVGNAQPQVSGRLGPVYQAADGNPVMTSDLGGGSYTGSGKTVDPQTANVTQQVTDANVATPGPALSVARTYNSLDPRTSQALGAGWSSSLDMSLVPDQDGSGAMILTIADGQQVRFAKNAAGGYAPPQDLYAAVATMSGGGFTITDQTGTSYTFAQASGSSWLISKIIDNAGRAETFGYSGSQLTTITSNVSGRALHLSWTTPSGATSPHVASVSTDQVIPGQAGTALTWTYGYTGDLLTSVCPPGTSTACTKYGYITNGSHAPTAVRNANPTAYWRLNDPSGASAAANQIPVNDLTTVDPPAEEMSTTPGVAGPVPGVTATGFNGSSSFIPLDGAWCTTPGQASSCITVSASRLVTSASTAAGFGLWFKTSTASGVLLGLSSQLPGNCTTNCSASGVNTPLLWIASNGELQAHANCTDGGTGCPALSTSTAVDNGAWHQAVVIPGQALYLDGKLIAIGPPPASGGSGSGSSPVYALLGAGLVQQNAVYWNWSFFNGSMADVAVYQDQLPSVGTVAAQYAAETHPAAELSSVMSPAGRTALSASYDTVNDRVASLTDTQGGTWTYSSPVRAATSAAYDDAVLSSGPQDFWPLSDSSGPLAQDLVGGSATTANPRPPATYANVTLGVPGPTGFPDGSATSFSGNGSQISIPGRYFSGAGGAGESAELWFQTSAAAGTLLSAGSGSGGNPPTVWIDAKGCLRGSIGSAQLGFIGGCSTRANDGNWHQAVLTLSPVTTTSGNQTLFPGPTPTSYAPGTAIQTATLYLDGAAVGSTTMQPGTASSAGYIAYVGNGSDGDFTGSIADVSLYAGSLSATDATFHYQTLHNQVSIKLPNSNPLSPPAYLATPTFNTQTITVTDPVGKSARYAYAQGNLVRTQDVLGGVSYYGYDPAGRTSVITDAAGDATYTTHDAYNNVTSTTTCAAVSNCQTVYTSYYENLSNPLDPRNNKPTDERDGRSSSPYDPAYDTVTAYTTSGQIASKTSPPTTACPAGCKTSYAYTTGSEAAVGGGTEPAGLLASVTGPGGGVTSYTYDHAGNVAQVTDPLGLVARYGYDNLGRDVTETQISSTYPNGLTTSYAYDGQDQLLTQIDPPVTDRVTGAVHTKVTSNGYDPDGNVLTTTVSDATGGDPSRTTTNTYDSHGNLAATKDAVGNTTSYTYDAIGDRVSQTNAAGLTTAYLYDAAGNLLTTTLDGYTGNPSNPIAAENLVLESRAYDPAGRLASVTNVRGTTTNYTYYGDNKLASSYIVCPACANGQEDVTSYGYDATGNRISETDPSGLMIAASYNAGNQVVSITEDPSGMNRIITASYDANGNTVSKSLTDGGVTQTQTMTYNALGQMLSQTVDNTGGNLTTTYVRDQRGLVISETDPAGNTTTIANDEAGKPVVETGPAVSAQTGNGAAPVTANPVAMNGYDAFGELTEYSDAAGNVTKATFDQDGQEVSITDPSYTAPGASAPVNGAVTMAYNSLGRETSLTDPDGNTTKMSYDQLGNLAGKTDPAGGTWTYNYDPAGEQISVIDPTGAQTQATYDSLGQMITTTDLVRQNTSASYTTSYGYDSGGNMTSQTTPTGITTKAGYDPLGEKISSTDGAGNTTSFTYNLDGNLARTTLPDGSASAIGYDQAGRPVSESNLDPSGKVLRTESVGYNGAGNVTSATDFRGDTTSATYDAMGNMVSQTQPVSSGNSTTTTFGYDLTGNRTAVTDGNGHTTYTTYNSLGLPESMTEPATAQWTSPANSQTVNIYDGDGNLVSQHQPGGVQVTSSYDQNGNLAGQTGTGASALTANHSYTYDATGRLLTAATSAAGTQGSFGYQPATSESFSWDDRGLLLSASGSAGTSAFTWNAAGQLASATDPAGTSSYTYDSAGRLATDGDAASGTTGTYHYNSLGQVTQISYGTGNNAQSFGYDGLHRLTADTVSTASGAQVAAIGYGYDANSNVTSMTTTGLASSNGTGTVTNSYGYDQANRLTSWTATPAGGTATTKTYGYDNNGNLVNDNGVSRTYDARNELVSDGSGNSYTYTANGDLATQASPGNANYTYATDAYGQQIIDGFSSFAWDALNRVITAGQASNSSYSVTLTYDGTSKDVASDPSATYSRDPAGQIVGVSTVSGGKTLALNNQHSDLSGTFAANGTSMTGSATWDPWGQQLASAGTTIQVGYQGQWTDPVTQQVAMGSRFYRGQYAGGFLNTDTAPGPSDPAASGSYNYAGDNPVTVTDPSGHSPAPDASSGGTITQADVNAAAARATAAQQTAARLEAAAAQAREAAARAKAEAESAIARAHAANAWADTLANLASLASAVAQVFYNAAQYALQQASYWQDQANIAWAAVRHDAAAAADHWYEPWVVVEDGYDAAKETAIALSDEARAGVWGVAYLASMLEYQISRGSALMLHALADMAAAQAVLADIVAVMDVTVAALAAVNAAILTAAAAAAEKAAAAAEAQYRQLEQEYQAQQREKAKEKKKGPSWWHRLVNLGKHAAHAAKKLGKKLINAGKTAGKVIASGAKTVAKGAATAAGVVGSGIIAAAGALAAAAPEAGAIASTSVLAIEGAAGETSVELSRGIKVGFAAATGGLASLANDLVHGNRDWVSITVHVAIGAATGSIGGFAEGARAIVTVGTISGLTSSVGTQAYDKGFFNVDPAQTLVDTLIGGLAETGGPLAELKSDNELLQNIVATVVGVAAGPCSPSNPLFAKVPMCH